MGESREFGFPLISGDKVTSGEGLVAGVTATDPFLPLGADIAERPCYTLEPGGIEPPTS
jgi:hypothetical protein